MPGAILVLKVFLYSMAQIYIFLYSIASQLLVLNWGKKLCSVPTLEEKLAKKNFLKDSTVLYFMGTFRYLQG